MRIIARILAIFVVAGLAGTVQAVVIDFEGIIPPGASSVEPILPYIEDGFQLTDIDSGIENALYGPPNGACDRCFRVFESSQ